MTDLSADYNAVRYKTMSPVILHEILTKTPFSKLVDVYFDGTLPAAQFTSRVSSGKISSRYPAYNTLDNVYKINRNFDIGDIRFSLMLMRFYHWVHSNSTTGQPYTNSGYQFTNKFKIIFTVTDTNLKKLRMTRYAHEYRSSTTDVAYDPTVETFEQFISKKLIDQLKNPVHANWIDSWVGSLGTLSKATQRYR